MKYRITLHFADTSVFSYTSQDDEGYLRAGEWTAPYPNTAEDCIVFGLIEAAEPEGVPGCLMWSLGGPVRTIITVEA